MTERFAAEFLAVYYAIAVKISKQDGTSKNNIIQYQQKPTTAVSNAIVINDCLAEVEEGDIISLMLTSSSDQTNSLVQGQITSLTVEAIEDGQTIIINNYI